MPFHLNDQIRYYSFESLDELHIPHAVISRQGGVSPAPWDSLNFGSTVGDAPSRVAANHDLAFAAVGVNRQNISEVWQVHGNDVVVVDGPRQQTEPYIKADSILTATPGVVLFMRFADCVPILLAAPEKHVIGLVHAGWQGTAKQAVIKAVKVMCNQFRLTPKEIYAAIGPSIGPDHYEIGDEVVHQFHHSLGAASASLFHRVNGSVHLDLWAANEYLLNLAGVTSVENARICTACHPDDWYSHRRDHGRTGRFGVYITLPG